MKRFIEKECRYGAKNYNPLPVCIRKGKGVYLTDHNSKKYLDFISAYSAVNQGHCHPRLINVLKKQASELTLTSRAIYNSTLGDYMEKACTTFNYDKLLPMNTGVEGGETAIKLARMWGYKKKLVESNKAINLFCNNNFWGRTLAALSSSSDPLCYQNFGPFMNGFQMIDYNDSCALEHAFKENKNIVSFMLEPIQGEAGIIIPDETYLTEVRELCNKYNVLMIADEVQTGLGRTGKMLACEYENVKPDILVLGKALSGGMMPISAVLADNDVMEVIEPGTHGSTFGGNPLAAAVALEALAIIKDEDLVGNSYVQGKYFREQLREFATTKIINCRGRGLLNAIDLESESKANALSASLLRRGLLAKTTHGSTLRLSPPLCITRTQIDMALTIIETSLSEI